MPRYFFHRTDGFVEHDEEGTELPDLQTARIQAVVFSAETLKDDPRQVWNGEDFRVEVTDDQGLLLFTIVTQAIDAAAFTQKL